MLFSKEHPLMSFAATFYTHKFVRRLKGAGFNDEQAKVLTEAVFESQASAYIATKGDLREFELRINARLEKVEGGINEKFEKVDVEIKLLKWMLAFLSAGLASLVLKAFF